MNSLEFTTAINTLSWAVAERFETVEELAVAGAIFTQIGDTLETIAALRELCGEPPVVSLPPHHPCQGLNRGYGGTESSSKKGV